MFVNFLDVKDLQIKGQALSDLVKQLPAEHYHTLAKLMLHLHAYVLFYIMIVCGDSETDGDTNLFRIQLHADVNLMNARNLGVVFGREYILLISLGFLL